MDQPLQNGFFLIHKVSATAGLNPEPLRNEVTHFPKTSLNFRLWSSNEEIQKMNKDSQSWIEITGQFTIILEYLIILAKVSVTISVCPFSILINILALWWFTSQSTSRLFSKPLAKTVDKAFGSQCGYTVLLKGPPPPSP